MVAAFEAVAVDDCADGRSAAPTRLISVEIGADWRGVGLAFDAIALDVGETQRNWAPLWD